MREVEYSINTLVSVITIAVFLPTTLFYYGKAVSGSYGGFDSKKEKSAIVNDAEINDFIAPITADDVMLSTLISDKYTPQPKTLVVGGYSFDLGTSQHLTIVDNFKLKKTDPLYRDTTIHLAWDNYISHDDGSRKSWKLVPDKDGKLHWEFYNIKEGD